jgi:hypothetical protein
MDFTQASQRESFYRVCLEVSCSLANVKVAEAPIVTMTSRTLAQMLTITSNVAFSEKDTNSGDSSAIVTGLQAFITHTEPLVPAAPPPSLQEAMTKVRHLPDRQNIHINTNKKNMHTTPMFS